MKDHIRSLLEHNDTQLPAGLIVREYLQARILETLQRAGAFQGWAFLGGTALRFLYRLPRFSEDLGFSYVEVADRNHGAKDEFQRFLNSMRRIFRAEAYMVEIRARPDQIVQSAYIGFPGLLYEFGLSAQKEQKLSIKIEVDTNPPPYASFETSVVRKHVFLNLLHYDKASLFAGKLHALLSRPHLKGRDVYDLFWYLSDPEWPSPNLRLLRAALEQTKTDSRKEAVQNWKTLVSSRMKKMDWSGIIEDVRPFLERTQDIEILTLDNLLSLLEQRGAD